MLILKVNDFNGFFRNSMELDFKTKLMGSIKIDNFNGFLKN